MTEKVNESFRDPSGFMFRHAGVLFRQVNLNYREEYDLLMSSGLYDQLTKSKTLVAHHEVDTELAPMPDIAYKVIQPDVVDFISYPYEWCFNQLKDAAILTLAIARRAIEFGMSLKDASAYNIQFHQGRPIFIDTLSFEKYEEGLPWVAYRQFCQHFLSPLALMAYKDMRLNGLLKNYIDGIPLDLTATLLPARAKLNFGLLTHIFIHAQSQARYADKQVTHTGTRQKLSCQNLLALLDNLLATIRRLQVKQFGTEWEKYYENTNYTSEAFTKKHDLVNDLIKIASPSSIWDLGGNTGEFSRDASNAGVPVVCFDIDQGAVNANYMLVKRNKEKNMLPLIQDLTNPSPAIGWNNKERGSLTDRGPVDLILALALIHHLAIANNLPFQSIADYFQGLSKKIIIEFVPKSDSQVQKLLASRLDIFDNYNVESFEIEFSRRFRILQKIAVPDSERTLYLMDAIM
jgi:ribosomal protein L11 methylase PrmA